MKPVVLAVLAVPFVLPVAARADEVFLKGGGKITGVVVERTATAIVIEAGPGRVSVPLSRVERVAESRSALQTYQEKAAKLAKDDVAGWLALAQWADDVGLDTQARAAYETVLALDPQNAAAHQGLGNVKLGESWVSEDEAYRARGYVKFEGRWVTPAEHEALLAEREHDASARREKAESDARIRESEAQAAAAEAEARRSQEAAKREAEEHDRVFWPPVYGPPIPPVPPCTTAYCDGGTPPVVVVPTPVPTPTPTPAPTPSPTPKPKPPSRGLVPKQKN